jgi:hypothetical protein
MVAIAVTTSSPPNAEGRLEALCILLHSRQEIAPPFVTPWRRFQKLGKLPSAATEHISRDNGPVVTPRQAFKPLISESLGGPLSVSEMDWEGACK